MDLSPLEKFGQEVRRVSDDLAKPGETVTLAKHRALAGWKSNGKSLRRHGVMVALLAAALMAIVFGILPARSAVITYSVGSSATPSALGAWIAADKEVTPVRFSDGTSMTLDPGARARVTRADSLGATMLVERGKAHAKVVHANESTSWLVHAGPFDIHVVGTEFDVAWNPTTEVLDLRVTEGKVLVRGPLLDAGRAVSASEVLQVDVQAKKSEVHVEANGSPLPVPGLDNKTDVPAKNPAPVETAIVHPEQSAPNQLDKLDTNLSWRAFAAAGRHREAMQAVEQAGFDRIVATSPADVLLELADEARYAGQHARAKQALLRARELGSRGRSAFLLGRIAADHDRAPDDAVTWFERYLEESPSGGLAEQALGRIVEIEDRLGHTARARDAAKLYLQRHPGGAYETLARRAVEP